jgi:hypothetical protein
MHKAMYTLSQPIYWYLYDQPKAHNSQKILERYITDAQGIFSRNISSLSDFQKPFTFEDEKHLCVMLELLLDARKIWEEESTSTEVR